MCWRQSASQTLQDCRACNKKKERDELILKKMNIWKTFSGESIFFQKWQRAQRYGKSSVGLLTSYADNNKSVFYEQHHMHKCPEHTYMCAHTHTRILNLTDSIILSLSDFLIQTETNNHAYLCALLCVCVVSASREGGWGWVFVVEGEWKAIKTLWVASVHG